MSKKIEKYYGILPAFYACYNEKGEVDGERTETFANHLINKGVQGLYVGGSSGECIYQTVEDRKLTLEHVMKAAKGKITVIAHVACNNTAQSQELARHAESLGVDAIAAIPPIYFRLPEYAIADYWNDISSAAPHTDFVLYNIPQLAGTALTMSLLEEMLKNPRVIGVKNSSLPTQDIQMFKARGGDDFIVFNGPDEQLVAGLAIGAQGGIGGTYGIMPELYLKITALMKDGKIKEAQEIQNAANEVTYTMCSCKGNMYAVVKEILRIREGVDIGTARKPLPSVFPEDMEKINKCVAMIDEAVKKFI